MKLLFICTHNRCRSILAEAIANHVGNGLIQAVSAGSAPEGVVHPLSLKYLSERGVSIDGLRSQSWNDFEDFNADAVLTMCDNAAAETCPVWFGDSIQVNWALQDPSKVNGSEQQQAQAFNRTINIIEKRLRLLIESQPEKLSKVELKKTLASIAEKIN